MSQAESSVAGTAAALKCELAGEVLRSFGGIRFEATGWSMLPSIWPGDTLVVERVGSGQVKVGDVVLIGRDSRLCGHRVVSRAHDSGTPHWITRGDGMPRPDQPASGNELLGRVSYLIRAGRLIAVPTELSVMERLIAKIVRRSVPAARALVYLHGVYLHCVLLHQVYLHHVIPVPEKSAPEESVLPCQC